MKIVVTGGAGFIGSHVVDLFLHREAEVLVVDDLSSGRRENLEAARREHSKSLQLCELDICAPETRARIRAFKPDLICHLGAQINVRRSVLEPQFDADKNIIGTINLLEAAKEGGVTGIIFASTGGAIYGEQEYYPADEKHPIRPECPYGISKHAAEMYLEFYARTYGLFSRSLRFANVYGPRQNPKGEAGVVAIFGQKIIAGEPLTINGDGEQTRDFVYVLDVVDAIARAADSASSRAGTTLKYDVFNVGCGKEISVNKLVETMQKAWSQLSERSFPEIGYGPGLSGEQKRSVINAHKIEHDLGWKPKVPLAEGLTQTINSFLLAK